MDKFLIEHEDIWCLGTWPFALLHLLDLIHVGSPSEIIKMIFFCEHVPCKFPTILLLLFFYILCIIPYTRNTRTYHCRHFLDAAGDINQGMGKCNRSELSFERCTQLSVHGYQI